MITNIQGLRWHTETPCRFELVSVRDDIGAGHSVSVEYDALRWNIIYSMPGRLPLRRAFASRDDAMALIASRAP